jgi:hypothetical protein
LFFGFQETLALYHVRLNRMPCPLGVTVLSIYTQVHAVHATNQGDTTPINLYMSICGSCRQSRRHNSNQFIHEYMRFMPPIKEIQIQSIKEMQLYFPEYMIAYYEYMRRIREGNYCGAWLLSRIIACHVWGISFYV